MNGAKSLGLSTGFVPFQVQLIFVGLVSCRSLALFYRIFLLSSDSVALWILLYFFFFFFFFFGEFGSGPGFGFHVVFSTWLSVFKW